MIAVWYRLHRLLGIVALVPVLAWSLSGLTHPLMAVARKPDVARNEPPPAPPPLPAERVALADVLRAAGLPRINNVRLVHFDGATYYQVQTDAERDPVGGGAVRYFDAASGQELADGDRRYAEFLASYYLGDESAPVVLAERVETFTPTYVLINRLLPVWRVAFARGDRIEVYVHTLSDRLATANDTYRRVNLALFAHGHTLAFLGPRESRPRLVVVVGLAALAFVVGLSGMGLYGLLFRKLWVAKQAAGGLRRWHRTAGVVVSLSLLGFAATGAWMAAADFRPEQLERKFVRDTFTPDELAADPGAWLAARGSQAENFSLVRIGGAAHVQLLGPNWRTEPTIEYLDVATGQPLADGDTRYAAEIAERVLGWPASQVQAASRLTAFEARYPAVFKRLPVTKLVYRGERLRVCHVETTSGHVSNQVTPAVLLRTIAFLNLHKYHFLDALGPAGRDAVMSLASLSIAAVAVLGLALFAGLGRRRGPAARPGPKPLP